MSIESIKNLSMGFLNFIKKRLLTDVALRNLWSLVSVCPANFNLGV